MQQLEQDQQELEQQEFLKEGGRPLRRLHWLASGDLCLSSSIKAETLTRDPYYRHFWQDASTGAGTVESGGSRPAISSQFQ